VGTMNHSKGNPNFKLEKIEKLAQLFYKLKAKARKFGCADILKNKFISQYFLIVKPRK
jgi:hypothetical protein